ncbi:hypothetical protein KEM55_008796, partial [Ascosphaera atra]
MPSGRLRLKRRIVLVNAWRQEGGVLLFSYDMFRECIHNKSGKMPQQAHEEIKDCLLKGTNIVIADEAHKLKNPKSDLSRACSLFKTKNRIGLTGTPLANNLVEYFSMIDWIAPGYLGSLSEFKSVYVDPVEAGLYIDSTEGEVRFSMESLAVLRKTLDPKVHRVDTSRIARSLPPKLEFVLTLPLTSLQREAYSIYVNSILTTRFEKIKSETFWVWAGLLGLLCNHPLCFLQKLVERFPLLRQDAPCDDRESEDGMLPEELAHQALPTQMGESIRNL